MTNSDTPARPSEAREDFKLSTEQVNSDQVEFEEMFSRALDGDEKL